MEDVKEENGSPAVEGEGEGEKVKPEEGANGATVTPEEGEVAAAEAAADAVMTDGATPAAGSSPSAVTNVSLLSFPSLSTKPTYCLPFTALAPRLDGCHLQPRGAASGGGAYQDWVRLFQPLPPLFRA